MANGLADHDLRSAAAIARANPVALYFREIGAVDRLTAAQERERGRWIEICRARRRRALASLPAGIDALLAATREVGRGDRSLDALLLLPGGAPITVRQRERLFEILVRLRGLRPRLTRSAIARRRAGRLVERLPLRPDVMDDLVGALRRDTASIGARWKPALREVEESDRALREAKRALVEPNLRLVVDPSGGRARPRRPGPDDPDAGPHHREHAPAHAGAERLPGRASARAERRGAGPPDRRAREDGAPGRPERGEPGLARRADRPGLDARRVRARSLHPPRVEPVGGFPRQGARRRRARRLGSRGRGRGARLGPA